jgi:MoaA/NifB/PqqE/SkfB family radical SAM enzyme
MNKGDEVNKNFKSKFLTDAEKAKEKLDNISPSLCLAKWKQVSLHLPTGLNNSCYHPPLHKISPTEIKDNPSALHNTPFKKTIRKQMLAGEKPTECEYCWRMEANGDLSDRHYRSGEPWAVKDFDAIVNSSPYNDIIPSYMEVNFSNACNLKCSYCSPQFSSSWMAEVKELGGYPTSTSHNDPTHFVGNRLPIPHSQENPYVDAFWEWWPDLYKELEHFRMTGGEPLMDKNTYKVFDYVLENPKPNLHLSVTSNFSVEEKLWAKYLDYVKRLCNGRIEHFMQYVSVDTWGKQAEYIRDGLDFNLMWDRVNQILEEVPYYSSLTFIITMNNLAVPGMQKFLEEIKQLRDYYSKTYQRVWFDTPVLRSPSWQSMQLLPEPYVMKLEQCKQYMEDNIETEETRFRGFKDYEINRMGRDIAWMNEPLSDEYTQEQKADFHRFFNEHDNRRNTNFLEVFPEMSSWWKECVYYANQG